MKIVIRTLTGKLIVLDVTVSSTLGTVKKMIHEKEKIPINQMNLIFKGTQMGNDLKSLGDYGIENESKIHLILRMCPDDDEEEGKEDKVEK